MTDQAVRNTRAQVRPQPRYHAMAKVERGWIRIGAAWTVRSGEDALSVQLTSIPMGWDGRFSLFPPNEQPETAEGESVSPFSTSRKKKDDKLV